jgi:hypothetical protein
MKDYLSAAFALLAATSQAAVLQAATDAQTIVSCFNPEISTFQDYNGYCYAPEDPTTPNPPNDCCWLYPDPNFGGNQLEMCYSTRFTPGHKFFALETVWHSMTTNKQFDNDAESW